VGPRTGLRLPRDRHSRAPRGTEAVERNLEPSWLSVLLTTVAVGPVVARRIFPLPVLVLTLVGLLLLVATRNTVGIATLGCSVAFYIYTAVGARASAKSGDAEECQGS